jgi:hypothetical protein
MKLSLIALVCLVSLQAVGGTVEWQSSGVGDCTGRDIGSTSGDTPDPAQAVEGRTAICWDGKTYSNRNNPGAAFCNYKSVARPQCTGGGNPGKAYTAVTIKNGWIAGDVGDCTGQDINATYGSNLPDPALAKTGTTAVCWDGKTYNNANRPGEAFCTYKATTINQCVGGKNPGQMYQPGAVNTMSWQGKGIGDCSGHDYIESTGSIPDAQLAVAGTSAVCWDGKTYSNRNAPGKAFCTYKNLTTAQCTGGVNPGWMYAPVSNTN